MQFTLAIGERGHYYGKFERYPEAVSTFDTVLEIHPSPTEAPMNKNWILGKTMSEKGRF
jgi:hypothetical protein